jgi:hypothetical protein
MKYCSIEGCGNRHKAKGYCSWHYQLNWTRPEQGQCTVDGCNTSIHSRDMCSKHYKRWYLNGGSQTINKEYNYKHWHQHLNTKSPLWENDCFFHGIGCKPQEYAWLELMCEEPLIDTSGNPKYEGLKYCNHKEHYAPICKKSHNHMDNAGSNSPGVGLDGMWNEVAVVSIPGTVIAQWGEEEVFHA